MLCRTVTGKAKAAAAVASARQDITLALSQPLPALLRKLQTEPIKVSTLDLSASNNLKCRWTTCTFSQAA